jgi:hypothetical protein
MKWLELRWSRVAQVACSPPPGGEGLGERDCAVVTPLDPAPKPSPHASPAGRGKRITSLVCIALLASVASAQSATDFSVRADVIAPPGASIVRVALPAASMAALRSANGGDLRIFNAAGVSLPHALIDPSTEAVNRAEALGQRLPALPIYASITPSLAATPTLRIEEGPNRRVIEYSSTQPSSATKPELRGLLFDARKVAADVSAVELEGALPNATIVKVSLEISTDLKRWRSIVSDAPVFDFGGDGPSNRRVVLSVAQTFKDHYIRLTSSAPDGLKIASMTTIAMGAIKTVAPAEITLGPPMIGADSAAEWTRSTGLRATGIRLQTSANNALMPVRILTRARAGDPWQLVASTVVFRLAGGSGASGGDSVNPAIPINSLLASQVRVEALRGYSLTSVPLTLTLEYPPLQALFIATGAGPFSLLTGKAGVDSNALPAATLMPNYSPGAEFAIPLSQATVVSSAGTRSGEPAATRTAADLFNRSTVLWAVLGLAVLTLGGLAVSLLRAPKPKGDRH